MKKSKTKAMSILEASDFFDEHDLFELGDASEVKNVKQVGRVEPRETRQFRRCETSGQEARPDLPLHLSSGEKDVMQVAKIKGVEL